MSVGKSIEEGGVKGREGGEEERRKERKKKEGERVGGESDISVITVKELCY